jgi:hypothetical protein
MIAMYFWSEKKSAGLLLQCPRCRLFVVTGALTLLFFFYHFTTGGTVTFDNREISFVRLGLTVLQGFLAIPGSILLYNDPGHDWKNGLASTIGAIEILVLLWLLWNKALRQYPALLMLLGFTCLTMLSIAAGRATAGGIAQSLQGHYKLYNNTCLLLLSVALLDWFQQKRPDELPGLQKILIALACLLHIAGFLLFLPMMKEYQQSLALSTRNWLHANTLDFPETRFYVPNFNRKLSSAVSAGVYDPWSLVDSHSLPSTTEIKPSCTSTTPALPALAESQRKALAVHILLQSPPANRNLIVCSPLQALRITLNETSYARNKNGARNTNGARNKNGTDSVELWVPRNPAIPDDPGPWQVFPLEN